jgi:transcriptional regulator with XRE-family HTH domain
MPRTSPLLPLQIRRRLRQLGNDIRDARKRRRLPTAVVAERAQISLPTLRRVERGDASVGIGTYATVLWVLGLSDRIAGLAAPETDAVGLGLEEERLPKRIRLKRKMEEAPRRPNE